MVKEFFLHIKNVHPYICSLKFYISAFHSLGDRRFSLQSLASFSGTFWKNAVLKTVTAFLIEDISLCLL